MNFSFLQVANRLKGELKLQEDRQLAAELDMSAASYAMQKKANSIPFASVITLASRENISLDYLFFGSSAPRRKQ